MALRLLTAAGLELGERVDARHVEYPVPRRRDVLQALAPRRSGSWSSRSCCTAPTSRCTRAGSQAGPRGCTSGSSSGSPSPPPRSRGSTLLSASVSAHGFGPDAVIAREVGERLRDRRPAGGRGSRSTCTASGRSGLSLLITRSNVPRVPLVDEPVVVGVGGRELDAGVLGAGGDDLDRESSSPTSRSGR